MFNSIQPTDASLNVSAFFDLPDTSQAPPVCEDLTVQQNEVERLKKQVDEKEKTIQQNIQTLRSLSSAIASSTKQCENFKEEIAKQTEALEDGKVQIAALESKLILLERQFNQYRAAPVELVEIQNEEQQPQTFWQRMWGGFQHGVSTVGTFCRNNRRLIEGLVGGAGVVLAYVFMPYAIPIFLGVGASIALIEWITSWF